MSSHVLKVSLNDSQQVYYKKKIQMFQFLITVHYNFFNANIRYLHSIHICEKKVSLAHKKTLIAKKKLAIFKTIFLSRLILILLDSTKGVWVSRLVPEL